MLHIISGTCIDDSLGTRIGGSDSLSLNATLDFEELPAKCTALFKRFRGTQYKESFSFIDHIKIEKNTRIKNQLDEQVLDALNKRKNTTQLSVAYPDQIEYEKCVSYLISGKGGAVVHDQVSLDSIYNYIGSETLALDDLKKIKIVGFDDLAKESRCTSSEPLYAYLTFETELNNRKYILSNRRWYEIDGDYIDTLNRDLALQVKFCKDPVLKPWLKTKNSKGKWVHDEGDYNLACSSDQDFLLLDKKLFSFGAGRGRSKVEIADLFHRPSAKLLCVKRLSASATLSHLFSQATVSAELFCDMTEYGDKFLSTIAKHWKEPEQDHSYIKTLKFVYAIGTDRTEPLLELLPIFSKVMLMKHIRMLQRTRFDVELTKVTMSPDQTPAPAAHAPKRRSAKPAQPQP
ncbi:hypothetical protein D7X12_24130 [Corallococcus sicarius]|uniref:Sporadically distributed protein, TIGR04141 family n=1 Tax=Corallococcus sicarius TaxID=2316726 RepID=A0A3A8N5Q9_9BACT|nr:hypothetical protein D7X12_24130 [Corallococcus sicarius]